MPAWERIAWFPVRVAASLSASRKALALSMCMNFMYMDKASALREADNDALTLTMVGRRFGFRG
eukprot:911920-Prymnesium_polylepis.1